MFDNMKIVAKLIGGFLIVAVVAGVIGIFGVVNMKNLDKKDTFLYENCTVPLVDIITYATNFQKYQICLRDMIESNDKSTVKSIIEDMTKFDVESEKARDHYKTTLISDEDKKLFEELLASDEKGDQIRGQIAALAEQNRDAEAMTLLDGPGKAAAAEMEQLLDKMTSLNIEAAKQTSDNNTKAANSATAIMITVLIIGVLIAIILGLWLSRMITKPLIQGVNMMQEMAKGHLGTRLKMNRADEIGQLADAMDAFSDDLQKNVVATVIKIGEGDVSTDLKAKDAQDEITPAIMKTTESLRGLIAEAGMLRKAAVEGKLATRGQADKFKGGYKDIVQGVNDCLDAVIGPLNVAAEYVDRISKGDIPAKITDSYNGDFNEIKNNLNRCIESLDGLIVQMKHMSDQHNLGDIDVIMPVEKFEGAYKIMAQGLNDMVNGHIAVKKKAMACIAEFGKGNFDATLEVFPGKKVFINNTIEKLRSNLKEFIAQMKHMSEQHDLGDIDVVIPAEKFEGSYKVMGEGVNKMVNGHIAVKKKAMACIAEMGKGNFDAPLEKFPGKKVFINNTIEALRDNLKNVSTEIGGLIEASKNGSLSTRGKAEMYQGDWQKIVKGINEMLDAILMPINEAAVVLEKVAARDMTVRVQGDYKGDHAKIKVSLNSAVDNLDKALSQVSEATEQVASGSQQISGGAQSLAQGANEQASSLEEVSSSLEEMSSMTKQNAENANQAKTLAGEANGNAAMGKKAMAEMSDAIQKIKVSSDQTAKIVKTIDEIAMQTNLLALNAAVEAARAGEAGRGFAVVAEEVRNLAQRSAEAAKNTANMIEESVKNAEDGVKIAVEVSKSFESIATGNAKVNDLIAEIAAASGEQSQGIEQVNTAVSQMDKVTQQNAANSEESASAAEEMSSQAEELQSMIAQFALSAAASKRSAPKAIAAPVRHEVPQIAAPKKTGGNDRRSGKMALASSGGNGGSHRVVKPADVIPLDDSELKEF